MYNRGGAVPQMLGMMHGIVSVALVGKCTVSTCMCRRQLVAWVGFLHQAKTLYAAVAMCGLGRCSLLQGS